MTGANKTPSIKINAFACPHCGVFTTQHWYAAYGKYLRGETPNIIDNTTVEKLENDADFKKSENYNDLLAYAKKAAAKKTFIDSEKEHQYIRTRMANIHASECYSCHATSMWVHEKLIYPLAKTGDQPNPDLPDAIAADYEEARSILNDSPRGAAALLRLCIQKMCVHMGKKGKDLNKDIGELVAAGLSPMIQKSLDIVRVIGNEAVHPGTLDLKDDNETATKLLKLVNLITEQLITLPNHIDQMYEDLIPEEKKEGIEKRDAKKI